jgi:hypothetical protein
VLFFVVIFLIPATAGTAAAATRVAAAAIAATGASAFTVTVIALGIGAIDCKACAHARIIYEVHGGIAQVVDGHGIYDNFDAVGFKRGVGIAEIIIERHPEIHAAAASAGDVNAQGKTFQFALVEDVFNCLACSRGKCEKLGVNFLEHVFSPWWVCEQFR